MWMCVLSPSLGEDLGRGFHLSLHDGMKGRDCLLVGVGMNCDTGWYVMGAWGWDGTMASPTWDGDKIDGLGMGGIVQSSPVQFSNDRAVRGSIVRGFSPPSTCPSRCYWSPLSKLVLGDFERATRPSGSSLWACLSHPDISRTRLSPSHRHEPHEVIVDLWVLAGFSLPTMGEGEGIASCWPMDGTTRHPKID